MGDSLIPRSSQKNGKEGLTYGESGRVNDRVDHHYLLQEGSHRAKGVPEHGSQVGQDLSLPTQLNESMFPCLRAAQLLDPRVYLCVGAWS